MIRDGVEGWEEEDRVEAGPPGIVPDADNAAFWDALAEGRVVVQECAGCGRRRFPRMPACPYCGSDAARDARAPGTGSVYSWVRVHRVLGSGDASDLPYTVATVNLDGGGRLFGRLEPDGCAAVGLRVAPVIHPHAGWAELRFRPEADATTGADPGGGP